MEVDAAAGGQPRLARVRSLVQLRARASMIAGAHERTAHGRMPRYDPRALARRAHAIVMTPEAEDHVSALNARDRATVYSAIERQLRYEPAVETRNRKRMDPDKRMYVAPWELRAG